MSNGEPHVLSLDDSCELFYPKAVRVQRAAWRTCIGRDGVLAHELTCHQALGVVEEVTVISKRQENFLKRNFEKAAEALVVALDRSVDDPAVNSL